MCERWISDRLAVGGGCGAILFWCIHQGLRDRHRLMLRSGEGDLSFRHAAQQHMRAPLQIESQADLWFRRINRKGSTDGENRLLNGLSSNLLLGLLQSGIVGFQCLEHLVGLLISTLLCERDSGDLQQAAVEEFDMV